MGFNARSNMILSNKRITKALIRLHGCAGWSAPLLFANIKDGFSHVEAHYSLILHPNIHDICLVLVAEQAFIVLPCH